MDYEQNFFMQNMFGKVKEIKPNWTRAENFHICFCRTFDR